MGRFLFWKDCWITSSLWYGKWIEGCKKAQQVDNYICHPFEMKEAGVECSRQTFRYGCIGSCMGLGKS